MSPAPRRLVNVDLPDLQRGSACYRATVADAFGNGFCLLEFPGEPYA